jgi:hypothetical protein
MLIRACLDVYQVFIVCASGSVVHMCVYVCVYLCMFVYVCVYIYIYNMMFVQVKAPDLFTPEALFAITDRLFLESKRQQDRDRAAASSGTLEG